MKPVRSPLIQRTPAGSSFRLLASTFYSHLQNGQFLSKNKIVRKTRKTALQAHYSFSAQKTDGRNIQYSKNETILKIGKMATMQRPLQNGQFSSKNIIARKIRKTTLKANYSSSMQKTDGRNSQYSKNETILKIEKMATMQRL